MTSLQVATSSGTTIESQFLHKIKRELGISRIGQVYRMTESASLLCSGLCAKRDDDQRHTYN